MAFFLSPVLNDQQFDANGEPRAGALISTYLAGTLTATTTYKTSTGTAHTNPIQLDSSGNYPNGTQLWLQGGFAYKFVITDSTGANSRTYDNITGVGDDLSGIDQWVLYGAAPTYISATSFSLVGDQTNTFQINRRLKSSNSGGTVYSTVYTAVFAAGITTITVTNTSGVLDSGLSAVNYGFLSADNQSIPAVSEAVSLQAGTTYTYAKGDSGRLVSHTNAAAIAGTLPAASTVGAGWWVDIQNRGAGTLTITPTTSTVDGAATMVLYAGQGVRIVSDGTNYYTNRGTAALQKYFQSANQTITASGGLTIAHGLGVKPTLIKYVLICLTAEGGYSIGNEITETFHERSGYGVSIFPDATNIGVRFASTANVFSTVNKTTGAGFDITAANWAFVVRAWA